MSNQPTAVIWIVEDATSTTIALDPIVTAMPFDRPRLALALRMLADRLESQSAAVEAQRPP